MFSAGGEAVGIFVHGVDIIEQVEARHQIEEARQAAENASRLKDEFLATLSHKLRIPLNAILGWTQMLRTQTLGVDEREMALSTIERNARSQNRIIENILDVSRITTGNYVLMCGRLICRMSFRRRLTRHARRRMPKKFGCKFCSIRRRN